MLTLIPFWIAPIVFVIVALIMSISGRVNGWRMAGIYGLAGFGLFLLAGTYTILHTRSSTAGLGFIFLPLYALLPGGIGIALGKTRYDYLQVKQSQGNVGMLRVQMNVLFVVLLIPLGWQLYAGFEVVEKNKSRDAEQARQNEAIETNKRELAGLLSVNPEQEADILRQKAAQETDRTMLIPIAGNAYAPADLLETLSHSTDLGVVLSVARNKNTSGKTLEWIFHHHRYPSYFFMDLAGNPNTPADILATLYARRDENGGIAWNLARNPNLPEDILDKLIQLQDKYVLRDILQRPRLGCARAKAVETTIKAMNDKSLGWLVDMVQMHLQRCAGQ